MGVLSCASEAANNPWGTVIFMVIIIGMFVLMMFFNRRSQKKRQEESQSILEALKPGNKVKTIGGICGVVVEICRDGIVRGDGFGYQFEISQLKMDERNRGGKTEYIGIGFYVRRLGDCGVILGRTFLVRAIYVRRRVFCDRVGGIFRRGGYFMAMDKNARRGNF